MKTIRVLILVAVTLWLAFELGMEMILQEAAPGAKSSSDSFVADSLILPSDAAVPATCGGRCGVQRWAVKTLNDVDRDSVRPRPVDTTIEALAALPRPARLPANRRIPPHEFTIYRVRGYLGEWDQEDDGDYHLVLFGLEDRRVSLIAEIPDPGCQSACTSGYAGRFAAARQALTVSLHQLALSDEDTLILEVVGVGFFDHYHGQTGAAPNFFELHPVLSLRAVN
jgi:hypothetical protein